MHILIVTDQHPDSLGGVQVALRLQRRYLERAGHTVTIAAPALHRVGYEPAEADRDAYIDLPSWAITRDREYGIVLPGRRSDRALDAALEARLSAGAPPVDLVHVQGDFWGAMIGLRAAKRHRLPLVVTMHNNVDEGTRAISPILAPIAFAALRLWRRVAVGRIAVSSVAVSRVAADRDAGRDAGSPGIVARGAWRYLAELASGAALVTAPSRHFADELVRHGVARRVEVTRAGVDDDAIALIRQRARSPRERPRLVWLGRMSNEKRVLEFVEALATAFGEGGVDADVVLHGGGLLLSKVERSIRDLGLTDRVRVAGPVPYAKGLVAMHDADALVQTSMGFETQGLTPFEAAALGTPTIFCDPHIAEDLGVTPFWLAEDGSVGALAHALREALTELEEPGSAPRVDPRVGMRLLQSVQTAEMVRLYEGVLAGRETAS